MVKYGIILNHHTRSKDEEVMEDKKLTGTEIANNARRRRHQYQKRTHRRKFSDKGWVSTPPVTPTAQDGP